MAGKKATSLVAKAFEVQEALLNDESLSPSLRLKVSQDIFDRHGYPKFSASQSLNTTKVIGGADLEAERKELVAEFKVIKEEFKQIEEGRFDDSDGEEA
jgi:hypothetical protein